MRQSSPAKEGFACMDRFAPVGLAMTPDKPPQMALADLQAVGLQAVRKGWADGGLADRRVLSF